jgi:hypothetical protein
MVRDLGEATIGVAASELLEDVPHLKVQLGSSPRREVYVEGLSDELVREGLALSVAFLDEDACLERLPERIDEAARAEPAHEPEHAEVELTSTDGCDLKQ